MNKKKTLSIISAMMCLSEKNKTISCEMMIDMRKEIQHRDDTEFIIIDNASTCSQENMRKNADIYVQLKENIGNSGGLNLGMKIASGDFFLFANNDIRIELGWIDLLLKMFNSNRKIGAISINDKMSFSGSFYAIRREVYEKVGEFDTVTFPIGPGSDADYLYRILIEGWDCRTLVYSSFKHLRRQTYTQKEFQKIHQKDYNYSHKNEFDQKWGFSWREWLQRGHKEWRKKIEKEPSLDRFNELKR